MWAILSTPIKTGDQKQLWSDNTVKKCLTDRFASTWQLLEGGLSCRELPWLRSHPLGPPVRRDWARQSCMGPASHLTLDSTAQPCFPSLPSPCPILLLPISLVHVDCDSIINTLYPTICLSICYSRESQPWPPAHRRPCNSTNSDVTQAHELSKV